MTHGMGGTDLMGPSRFPECQENRLINHGRKSTMAASGETEAGHAGTQLCQGIAGHGDGESGARANGADNACLSALRFLYCHMGPARGRRNVISFMPGKPPPVHPGGGFPPSRFMP